MKIEVRVLILLAAMTIATLGISNSITFITPSQASLSALLLTAVIIAATYFFARSITQPLRSLIEHANGTKFVEPPKPLDHAQDELGEVADAFGRIEAALQQSIEHLEQTVAIKERMESELTIGRQIQMNLLTLTFPSFPKRKNLDLYATLKPAREVSGDFYDFYFYREHKSFLLEANRFCFCVGDVSGKGVPAALFMAVTKILLKSQADQHASPATILSNVNQATSLDNPSCMFVTLFFGVLNLLNGELVYTNAGHNAPYVQRQTGELEQLHDRHGPALGIVEDRVYRESRTMLNAGDLLIVFTDGVTEAMDRRQNLFSEQRFVELLKSKSYSSAQEVIQFTTDAVDQFQGDAEQADDLTMLSLRFLNDEEERSKLSLKKDLLSSLRDKWE